MRLGRRIERTLQGFVAALRSFSLTVLIVWLFIAHG